MTYALIQNDTVVTYPLNLAVWREENSNISLPYGATETQLNEQDIYTVYVTSQPSYDWITQSCTEGTPEQTGSQWFQTWVVTENTPEQIAYNEEKAKQQNKAQAESLLQQTDWVELNDVTDPENPPFLANKTEFTAYRAALRTIAVNPPITVTEWPIKPEEVWSNS